jgi:hypothetical protein
VLFDLNKIAKSLGFTIRADGPGVCNITIPRRRLDNPFNVTVDGTLTIYDVEQNETDSTISFSYVLGTHHVEITATERGHIIGDTNGDGQVNIVDITIAAINFGRKEEYYP